MTSIDSLTRADLEEIGRSSYDLDDPRTAASLLVDAVVQGRVADRADVATALLIAAEIYERTGDLEQAEGLARRAVDAHRRFGDDDYGLPQAYWAGLLLRLGYAGQGMAELETVRPLLVRDPLAATYVSEALVGAGCTDMAVHWLTAALLEALAACESDGLIRPARHLGVGSPDWADDRDQAAFVTYTLAQRRCELRGDLGLPRDEYDALAAQLRHQLGHALDEAAQDDDDFSGIAVLYWPYPDLTWLLESWPDLVGLYGQDWDEHRANLERDLSMLWQTGRTGLALLVGSAGEFADYLARTGQDPTQVGARQGYAETLAGSDRELPWPPGRNAECWCGSRRAYRSCCRPYSEGMGWASGAM